MRSLLQNVALIAGIILFALVRRSRRDLIALQTRLLFAFTSQFSTGRHTKRAISRAAKPQQHSGGHRGSYPLWKDLSKSLSGHGIGWGSRVAL